MTFKAFDCDSERSLIANWVDNSRFREAFPLDLDLIRSGPHREIAKVVSELSAAGAHVDDSAVVLELEKRDRLDSAGGFETVSDLLNNTPISPDPWRIVDRLRNQNALVLLRNGLAKALSGVDTGSAGLEESKDALSAILTEQVSGAGPEVVTVQQALLTALNTATTSLADDAEVICKTNFYALDNICGHLRRQHCWVFGATSNWGKSSFTVALVDEVMHQGLKVLIVSNEDSAELYGRRLLARRSGVNAIRLRDRNLDQTELAIVTDTVNRAPKDPFFLSAMGKPVEVVASEVRSECAAKGIDLVVFDYAQKFRSRKTFGTRTAELEYIRDLLSDCVKMSNACCWINSQLTDVKPGERPTKDNLRDCKSLGHGAEFVLLGFTESEDRRIHIDKVKDGPAGAVIGLDWDIRSASFRSDRQREDSITGGDDFFDAM